jgi:hypothetical protein
VALQEPPVLPALDPSLPLGVALVKAGLDVLAAQAPAEMAPDTALLVTQELLVAHDRLQALALRHVADVDRRELHALDDSPSTGLWVAEQATSFGRAQVALAGKLDRIPQVAARIAEGGLSVDAGVLIGRALDRLRRLVDQPDGRIDGQPAEEALFGVIVHGVCSLVGQARGGLPDSDPLLARLRTQLLAVHAAPLPELARLESAFLLLARHLDSRHLKPALGLLVDALRPNELIQDAADDEQNRGFVLTKDPDRPGWTPGGHLDDETGELFHTALLAAAATDPDNPLDTEAAAQLREQGLDPYAGDVRLVRTKAQRMHDALRLLLQRSLGANVLGSRGQAPVHLAVTVSSDALDGVPGALPARGSAGQTLPISLVRKLACHASLTRFVLSLGHKVLETSHTARTLKPHQRKVKHVETGGICQAAGCTRGDPTGHPLIPHHVTPWAKTRRTSLDDTALLCESNHHDVHHGRTLRLKDGRRFNANGWLD